jgi:hypothetical protein
MSLSNKNLSLIQKAGQASFSACEAVSQAVVSEAKSMVSIVSTQPFAPESEHAIARFKALSTLSHELVAVEAKLKALYASALELSNPASNVIMLPAAQKVEALEYSAAVDVVAKPSKKAAPVKSSKKTKNVAGKPATLTPNDNKLLKFLQRALKDGSAKTITGSAMSAGSKLPLGSVGLSLKKIMQLGLVEMLARGTYKLSEAQPAPAPAAEPQVEAAPAKPVKAEVKKAKPSKVTKIKSAASAKLKAKAAKTTKPESKKVADQEATAASNPPQEQLSAA